MKLKQGKYGDTAINALCSKHSLQLKGRINPLRLLLVKVSNGAALAQMKTTVAGKLDCGVGGAFGEGSERSV